jgi:hypothetical protein
MCGTVDRVGAMRSSVMFGPGAFLEESAGTVARSELTVLLLQLPVVQCAERPLLLEAA